MLQIKNTLGGGKPEGLYAWKKNEIGSELKVFNKSVSTLPFNFASGSAVVLNGEIHILGSGYSGDYTKHYKWDGSSWVSVSTLPYRFYEGSAVVFNNEIHLLGGNHDKTAHYKREGSSWTSVGTLPYTFYDSPAVIFDNGVYILGSSTSDYSTAHYLIIGYAPTYTFLDYIVSDKETAYPDGGEKGGYWYEKVVEGAKVSTGSITNTISSLENLVIEHGLGKTPTKFAVIASKVKSAGVSFSALYNTNCYLNYFYSDSMSTQIKSAEVTPTINDTTISIPSCMIDFKKYYWAKVTYSWIAIAE